MLFSNGGFLAPVVVLDYAAKKSIKQYGEKINQKIRN